MMSCFNFKKITFLLITLLYSIFLTAQVNEIENDSMPSINLDKVVLFRKLKFDSKDQYIKYLILKRKVIKVFPYARMAAIQLDSLNNHLETLPKKRFKKRHIRKKQRQIKNTFSKELKNLTRTEGQILVKLLYRQTGQTAYNLVKELKSGWRAFWYNTQAGIFNISLKKEFNPKESKEDFYIEDILQRAFQEGTLERQKPKYD